MAVGPFDKVGEGLLVLAQRISALVNRKKDCALRFLGLHFGARGLERAAIARSVDCLCEVPSASTLED